VHPLLYLMALNHERNDRTGFDSFPSFVNPGWFVEPFPQASEHPTTLKPRDFSQRPSTGNIYQQIKMRTFVTLPWILLLGWSSHSSFASVVRVDADEDGAANTLRRLDVEVKGGGIENHNPTDNAVKQDELEDALTLGRQWDRALTGHTMSMPCVPLDGTGPYGKLNCVSTLSDSVFTFDFPVEMLTHVACRDAASNR
jgi:hypothetical protein